METQKVALFDVDGVIVKGFIICEFPKFLYHSGYFNSNANDEIQSLLSGYLRGEKSPREVGEKIPQLFANGIKGFSKENIEQSAKVFMQEYQKNIFRHSEQLVRLMKKKGYFIIAMSGSPIEAVAQLKYMGFDEIYGTEAELINGCYSGNIKRNLVVRENKEKLFHELVKRHNINLTRSFGFGDTEQDLPVLNTVGNPVPVNPDKGLTLVAKERNWPVITDEKSFHAITKKLKI